MHQMKYIPHVSPSQPNIYCLALDLQSPMSRRVSQLLDAATTVLQTAELLLMVLGLLSLTDLVKLRRVSKPLQAAVQAALQSRVYIYTSPFFPTVTARDGLLSALNKFSSLIVGSVPLAALSMPSRPPPPDNLNIISTFPYRSRWFCELTVFLGFTVAHDGVCTGPYEEVGYRFIRFVHASVPVRLATMAKHGSSVAG